MSSVPQKTHHHAPPSYLKEQMKTDAGKGVSTDAADNLVPLCYVLQKMSPQVDDKNPGYIAGARPGDIWLRNYENPVVKGSDGILFQPCYFTKDWVEWVPRERGGGLVARYKENELPDDCKKADGTPKTNVGKIFRPNGNEVQETRYHAGFVYVDGHPVPYVINFSSTGHTVSRQWMQTMNTHRDENDEVYPSFSQMWRMRTRQRSNSKGSWFVFEPTFDDYVDAAAYARGRSLYQAFASGEKEAEMPIADQTQDDDSM